MDFVRTLRNRNNRANRSQPQYRATKALLIATALLASFSTSARGGGFDIVFEINPSGFNSSQLAVLNDSLDYAEALWEGIIKGYPAGVTIPQVTIQIREGSALASANPTAFSNQGGIRYATAGFVNINDDAIDISQIK